MSGESGLKEKTLALRIPCADGSLKGTITPSRNLLIRCLRACAAKSHVDITRRLILSSDHKPVLSSFIMAYITVGIDPMQKWPPLLFVTEKNYLLTEIYYFTVKIRSKGITV